MLINQQVLLNTLFQHKLVMICMLLQLKSPKSDLNLN